MVAFRGISCRLEVKCVYVNLLFAVLFCRECFMYSELLPDVFNLTKSFHLVFCSLLFKFGVLFNPIPLDKEGRNL